MSLVERVKKSEVFSELKKEELAAILQAIKLGDEEIIKEVTGILNQEDAISHLFDESIKKLTERTISVMGKRLKVQKERHEMAEKELAERTEEQVKAEHELETADLSLKSK